MTLGYRSPDRPHLAAVSDASSSSTAALLSLKERRTHIHTQSDGETGGCDREKERKKEETLKRRNVSCLFKRRLVANAFLKPYHVKIDEFLTCATHTHTHTHMRDCKFSFYLTFVSIHLTFCFATKDFLSFSFLSKFHCYVMDIPYFN